MDAEAKARKRAVEDAAQGRRRLKAYTHEVQVSGDMTIDRQRILAVVGDSLKFCVSARSVSAFPPCDFLCAR